MASQTVTILPKYLSEKLTSLGYKILNTTSPTPNAYILQIIPVDPGGPTRQVFIKSLTLETTEEELQLANGSYNFEADLYFANETTFYAQILANYLHLEQTFHEAINVPFSSVPTCLYADTTCVILEDLYAAGYQPLDISKPLTFEHARVVLQQLGRLHAFSIALRYHHPHTFEELHARLNPTGITDETSRTILIEGVKDALKLARASFPKNSIYVDKLSYFILDIYKTYPPLDGCSARRPKFKKPNKPRDTYKEAQVLTHGDLWPNNILLKTIENHVESAKFVDFQGCQLASWVNDLMAVIMVAVNKPTRDEHLEELYECYRNAMCLKLEELQVDEMHISRLFAKESFEKQLRITARYAMATAVAGLPLYLKENADVPTVAGNDDPVVQYFRWLREKKSMKCKNKMLEIIMDVVDYGYMD